MIDIHSHILPGVDDGAGTLVESLQMAQAAVREGIHTIIATPHHRNGVFDNDLQDIKQHVAFLNGQLQEEGIPLEVLVGQETRIHGDMVEELEAGVMAPLAGTSYVLVEFPSSSVPRYAKQLIFNIQVAGYKPIIVHPERNIDIQKDTDILYELVRKGALAQVTAGSLVGQFGKTIQRLSNQLIEANLVHFLASDAHNTTSRGFYLRDAYAELHKEHGAELHYLFMENTHLLLDNKTINRMEPELIKKKKFLGLF